MTSLHLGRLRPGDRVASGGAACADITGLNREIGPPGLRRAREGGVPRRAPRRGHVRRAIRGLAPHQDALTHAVNRFCRSGSARLGLSRLRVRRFRPRGVERRSSGPAGRDRRMQPRADRDDRAATSAARSRGYRSPGPARRAGRRPAACSPPAPGASSRPTAIARTSKRRREPSGVPVYRVALDAEFPRRRSSGGRGSRATSWWLCPTTTVRPRLPALPGPVSERGRRSRSACSRAPFRLASSDARGGDDAVVLVSALVSARRRIQAAARQARHLSAHWKLAQGTARKVCCARARARPSAGEA